MWMLALLGCGAECVSTPRIVNAPASVETEVQEHLDWTGQQCLAEVRVTASSLLGGETWRDDEGWTVTVLPDEAGWALPRKLCEVWALEHAGAEPPGGMEAFVEACARGPIERPYVEQEVAGCGTEPLTETEVFLEERVWTTPLPTAPMLTLERTHRAVREAYQVIETTDPAVLRGAVAFLEPSVYRPHLEVDTVDARYRLRLEELGEHSVRLVGGDDERVVLHTMPPTGTGGWRADARTTWVIDRATGSVTEHAVDWPLDRNQPGGGSVLLALDGGALVSQASRLNRQGTLGLHDFEAGQVRIYELPVPRGEAEEVVVLDMWRDPDTPGAVLLHLQHQTLWVGSDAASLRVFEQEVTRLDLETGEHDMVWAPAPLGPREREMTLLGPLPGGRMAVEVLTDEGVLLGALTLLTGEMEVSGQVCAWRMKWQDGRLLNRRVDGEIERVELWAFPSSGG